MIVQGLKGLKSPAIRTPEAIDGLRVVPDHSHSARVALQCVHDAHLRYTPAQLLQ